MHRRTTARTAPAGWAAVALACLLVVLASRLAPASPPEAVAPKASHEAVAALERYLAEDPATRQPLDRQPFAATPLTREDTARAGQALWADHVQRIRRERAAEIQQKRLHDGDKEMAFEFRVFGTPPRTGRSLYISMHGGGGIARQDNDAQWEGHKGSYKPAEGIYLAPRSPTDAWDMWHQAHVDRLFGRLIGDAVVLLDVNPNRVYLMGFSAGGDGVYQLAPRMADRFAAASMMAGHPNDASPLGLRNLPFAILVGERDDGYKRNEIARQWGEQLARLRKEDRSGYEHVVKLYSGKGHSLDGQEAEAVPWMARHIRNPLPQKVVWKQAGVTHDRFYWLAVPPGQAKAGALVVATREGQRVNVTKAEGIDQLRVRLNDRMLDLDRAVVVTGGGRTLFEKHARRTIGVLAATLAERGDPAAVFSAEVEVKLAGP